MCFLQNSSSYFSHCHFCFGTSTTFCKATCNTLSLLILSLITTFPINTPILRNTIFILMILAITTTTICIIITPSSSSSASPTQSTFLFPSPLPTSSTLTPSLLQLLATLRSLPLSPSPLRKSVSCNYRCEYSSISLQPAVMILITLLFNVILNFQSTKMILGFNIFSIFILFILSYAKFYTKFGLDLTYNITLRCS